MALAQVFQQVYFKDHIVETNSFIYELSSFFGLPNNYSPIFQLGSDGLPNDYVVTKKSRLTWGKIAKNFIGWPSEKKSALGLLFRFPLMLLITIGHILQCISKTFLNSLKLVTELLPKYLAYLIDNSDWFKRHTIIKSFLLSVLAVVYTLGRSLTSPFSSAYGAYQAGKKIHPLVGICFALLYIACFITLYSLIFPLLIQAIAVNFPVFFMEVGSFISTHLPWLANAALTVVSSPVLQGIAHSFLAVFNSLALPSMPIWLQVTTTLSLGLFFVGQGIQSAIQAISEKCCKKRPPIVLDRGSSFANDPQSDFRRSPTQSFLESATNSVQIKTTDDLLQVDKIKHSKTATADDSGASPGSSPAQSLSRSLIDTPRSRPSSTVLKSDGLTANSIYQPAAESLPPAARQEQQPGMDLN